MEKQLKVTYHHNSGFSVQVGSALFVFDYWEGERRRLSPVGQLNTKILSVFEEVYVFVSHVHADHLDPIIYEWREELPDINYIVSSDLPIGKRGKRIAPLETLELTKDISVSAFDSTDLGVSFLVTAYGMKIFHAGDLNLWHWRQESSLREIEAAEEAFYKACDPIPADVIDLAMFPVDPRQECCTMRARTILSSLKSRACSSPCIGRSAPRSPWISPAAPAPSIPRSSP